MMPSSEPEEMPWRASASCASSTFWTGRGKTPGGRSSGPGFGMGVRLGHRRNLAGRLRSRFFRRWFGLKLCLASAAVPEGAVGFGRGRDGLPALPPNQPATASPSSASSQSKRLRGLLRESGRRYLIRRLTARFGHKTPGLAQALSWLVEIRLDPRPASSDNAAMTSRTKSEQLFAEALKYIPGGVNSPVRAFRAVGGQPFFVNRAKGARVWDVDGNEYLDYVGTWGPAILGHAHPKIIKAVQAAAQHGTSFGIPNPFEVTHGEADLLLGAERAEGADVQLGDRGHACPPSAWRAGSRGATRSSSSTAAITATRTRCWSRPAPAR